MLALAVAVAAETETEAGGVVLWRRAATSVALGLPTVGTVQRLLAVSERRFESASFGTTTTRTSTRHRCWGQFEATRRIPLQGDTLQMA